MYTRARFRKSHKIPTKIYAQLHMYKDDKQTHAPWWKTANPGQVLHFSEYLLQVIHLCTAFNFTFKKYNHCWLISDFRIKSKIAVCIKMNLLTKHNLLYDSNTWFNAEKVKKAENLCLKVSSLCWVDFLWRAS